MSCIYWYWLVNSNWYTLYNQNLKELMFLELNLFGTYTFIFCCDSRHLFHWILFYLCF